MELDKNKTSSVPNQMVQLDNPEQGQQSFWNLLWSHAQLHFKRKYSDPGMGRIELNDSWSTVMAKKGVLFLTG